MMLHLLMLTIAVPPAFFSTWSHSSSFPRILYLKSDTKSNTVIPDWKKIWFKLKTLTSLYSLFQVQVFHFLQSLLLLLLKLLCSFILVGGERVNTKALACCSLNPTFFSKIKISPKPKITELH